ncbi:hypothetical protein CerSpe_240970 [Prunus speciosa]
MAEVTTCCFSRVALLMILYILHQPCVAECTLIFNWLSFEGVTGVSIIGGAREAKGTALWACKLAGSTDCPNGGATDLWIEQVTCGPGHGISIGSLAKDLEQEGVQNVTVKNAIFKGTQNGLRIKSWARPSNRFVQGVQFLDVVMFNVQNPIVIDQNYCPHNINCPAQVSGVKVSDVVYQNIRGTSATAIAIKFDCSATNPCSGIRLENVSLTSRNQEIQSHCANANGKIVGTVQPNVCL